MSSTPPAKPLSAPSPELPPIERLCRVMAILRDPEGGCPWDIEQSFASIAPYTIEEAYEVADAIARKDMPHLEEELGDLLLQVVYHAQIGSEAGHFDMNSVANAITEKMIRRHPHVFADAIIGDAEARSRNWEAQKARERAQKAKDGTRTSALDDIAPGFPALMRALKLQRRAARTGFDWPEAGHVLEKLDEEIAELRAEMAPDAPERNADRLEDELGDLLFVCVNLARKLNIDPESALHRCNRKFERRFRAVETMLHDEHGQTPEESTPQAMEALWQRVKLLEKS